MRPQIKKTTTKSTERSIPVIKTDMGSVIYRSASAEHDKRLSRFSPFRSLKRDRKKKLLSLPDHGVCVIDYPPRRKQRFALVQREGELFSFYFLPLLSRISVLPCDLTEEDGGLGGFLGEVLNSNGGARDLILDAVSKSGVPVSSEGYGRVFYLTLRYLYGEDTVEARIEEPESAVDPVPCFEAVITAAYMLRDMKMTELMSPPVTVEEKSGRITVTVRGLTIYEGVTDTSEYAVTVLRHFVCKTNELSGAFALAIAIELALFGENNLN